MITHLVLFKLRPGITPDDPRIERVMRMMAELPRQIPVIRGWEYGCNITPDAEAWDFGLLARFDDESDLHAYFEHPAHLPVLQLWSEIATLAFADLAS